MQPEVDATSAAAAPTRTAAQRARKALASAGKSVWSSAGKGALAFGAMFKAAEKPMPAQNLELQEMPAHKKSSSISSSVVSSELEQI